MTFGVVVQSTLPDSKPAVEQDLSRAACGHRTQEHREFLTRNAAGRFVSGDAGRERMRDAAGLIDAGACDDDVVQRSVANVRCDFLRNRRRFDVGEALAVLALANGMDFGREITFDDRSRGLSIDDRAVREPLGDRETGFLQRMNDGFFLLHGRREARVELLARQRVALTARVAELFDEAVETGLIVVAQRQGDTDGCVGGPAAGVRKRERSVACAEPRAIGVSDCIALADLTGAELSTPLPSPGVVGSSEPCCPLQAESASDRPSAVAMTRDVLRMCLQNFKC